MAYVPSRQDLLGEKAPPDARYVPTREELLDGVQEEPGILSRIAQEAVAIPQRIGREAMAHPGAVVPGVVGGLARGAQELVSVPAHWVGAGLGYLGFPRAERALEAIHPVDIIPGYRPELTPTISQLAETVPAVAAGGRDLLQLGGAGIRGIGAGISGIGRAGREAIERTPVIRELFGRAVPRAEREYAQHASNMLTDYYDTPLYEGQIGEEDQAIARVLHKHNDRTATRAQELYGEISPEEWSKKINKPDAISFVKKVKRLGRGELGTEVTNRLNTFLRNPTAKNAHEAQSMLGRQVADFYSRDIRPPKEDLNALQNLRKDLRSKIGEVAGNKYQKASDYYKENRVPYTEDPVIVNVLKGRVPSAQSLARRMAKGETLTGEEAISTNALKAISKHLEPEDKEKMILPFIKGTPGNPVLTVSGELNPDVIRTGMESLKVRGLEKFMSPQMYKDLNKLNKLAKEIEKQKVRTKLYRVGVPAAAALLGIPGVAQHYAREIF